MNNNNNLSNQFNEINILILTDVHSWIGGHALHESPNLDIDYGHVLSFHTRLLQQLLGKQEEQQEQQQDLFFVMNGDFVDGTGLGVQTYEPPRELVYLLEYMPWDAVNVGNHELYWGDTVRYLTQKDDGFVSHWNGTYVTSNVLLKNNDDGSSAVPMGGVRHTTLVGPNTGVRVLTFGFLYDFMDNDTNATIVERVEDVVQQDWFHNVVSSCMNNEEEEEGGCDAVLVMAHMDVKHPLLTVILSTIRSIWKEGGMEDVYSIPIQFVTGHTHYRGYEVYDESCTSIEAGRFLDTIGFVSFPSKRTWNKNNKSDDDDDDHHHHQFRHRFLDANKRTLSEALGVTDDDDDEGWYTPQGRELSHKIQSTRENMNLTKVVGCSPRTFYLTEGLDHDDSLWRLYIEHVLPNTVFNRVADPPSSSSSSSSLPSYDNEHDRSVPSIPQQSSSSSTTKTNIKVMIQGTGALRYSLFQNEVTKDDIIAVSPFNDLIYHVASDLHGEQLLRAYGQPNVINNNNNAGTGIFSNLPQYAFAFSDPSHNNKRWEVNNESIRYSLYTADYDLYRYVLPNLKRVLEDDEGGVELKPVLARDDRDGQTILVNSLWEGFVKQQWGDGLMKREDGSFHCTNHTSDGSSSSSSSSSGTTNEGSSPPVDFPPTSLDDNTNNNKKNNMIFDYSRSNPSSWLQILGLSITLFIVACCFVLKFRWCTNTSKIDNPHHVDNEHGRRRSRSDGRAYSENDSIWSSSLGDGSGGGGGWGAEEDVNTNYDTISDVNSVMTPSIT